MMNVYSLEKKRVAFDELKKASLNAPIGETETKYEAEILVAKRMFQTVKKDMVR